MKKAELTLTTAWQNKSPYLSLLSPLSALYGAVSSARKSLYHKNIFDMYRAPVPVLVIGNITVGGSGKTPLIITMLEYLLAKGVQVGVISRGYGGDSSQMPRMVMPDSTPDQVGDEPCLIVQSIFAKTGDVVPMVVGANRKAAIELLLSTHLNVSLIISDDGLQHYALHRDVEWIVVDAARGFGNGKLLPQGFLREPISRLDGATIVYHDARLASFTGEFSTAHYSLDEKFTSPACYSADDLTMYLRPSELVLLLPNSTKKPPQASDRIYAISGIGYPKRFFDTLGELGFDVVPVAFGDHHQFVLADVVDFADLPIIITAKDAVKLRTLAKEQMHPIFENIWVLPVSAQLSQAAYQQMDALIERFELINQ